MLTNLYFVRHAHSTYTPDELERPLSEKGFNDAKTITKLLQREEIYHVLSSPYQRAIQTIEGIANYINKEIEIIEDLRERTLTLEPTEDFDYAISKVWEDPHFSWEGGESNNTAQKRGVIATIDLLKKYQGKNIVLGTHGNIMVLIMNYFDHKYDFQFWKQLKMPDVYRLTFEGEKLSRVKRCRLNV
ncbi:histidine phosphatase family protein [Ferdinandcohnia quinoae]|uniref:Histidine phosphatase family protein n=1 Tax=Fredinandcohnia quinoae TaxID=2918902 RepID=A0AAW5E7F0_9BACI|nr:histidine phosphatase family protein [Fredinandcohnia sp. SECRCQ15]MCH1627155.1 histidine phosphatase family protein [Fredinandcohnia sp. SECRCQ15]